MRELPKKPEIATQRPNVGDNYSKRRMEHQQQMKEGKRDRLSQEQKNRYSQFRDQFDDIFEVTLSKRKTQEVQEEVEEFKKMGKLNEKSL